MRGLFPRCLPHVNDGWAIAYEKNPRSQENADRGYVLSDQELRPWPLAVPTVLLQLCERVGISPCTSVRKQRSPDPRLQASDFDWKPFVDAPLLSGLPGGPVLKARVDIC